MTARLAPALTGPPAPTSPSATGCRPGSTSGDDFSALLGAAGDKPADARSGLLDTPRRLGLQARPEPRQAVRPVEERPVADRAADRAAADRRTADRAAERAAADRQAGDDRRADDRRTGERPAGRRVDERRVDERRAEAQRAAGDERAARRESVERRQQEDASARADRSALRRESQRRAGADEARDQAETPVGRGEQAQAQAPQREGEVTAEPGQAVVVPADDPVTGPAECPPGAALVDPALLTLVGAALDPATTQVAASPHEGPEAGVAGLVPDLAGAPLPQSATVPQPVVGGEGTPVTVPVADLTAASAAAPTGGLVSGPTGTDAGQGVPLADAATTTVATSLGPVDVTVLDGATALPGDTGAGAGPESGPQDGAAEPPAVVPGPVDDAPAAGVEGGEVAVQAGPPTVPAQRAEAAVSAAARAEAPTPVVAPTAEAAVERTHLGATVADMARAAHRDGSGATRVVIRLDPPELGTVTIAVTVRGGDVRVSLLAEAGVVPVLDSRREDVHRALSDAGLALGGYDVSSGSHQGQERQQEARDRAAAAGRPWRALGPEMDFERAAAVDRAARGVWL